MTAGFTEFANRTPMTFVVVIAYVTMAFLTGFDGPTGQQMAAFGACSGQQLRDGELWRLLTYAFLHGGLMHLGFNTYCLIALGPALEVAVGSLRFTALYAVAAIGGGILACQWQHPAQWLVGGSGSLFGIIGALLAIEMRRGRHLLEFLTSAAARSLIVLAVANLIIGMVWPGISNAAHVGGLLAGFAFTFCFLERGRDPIDGVGRVIRSGWATLLATQLLWLCLPVTRWDYLLDHLEAPAEPTRAPWAEALLLRTDDLRDPPLTEPRDRAGQVEVLRRIARGG